MSVKYAKTSKNIRQISLNFSQNFVPKMVVDVVVIMEACAPTVVVQWRVAQALVRHVVVGDGRAWLRGESVDGAAVCSQHPNLSAENRP